jgi:murein lipoprotein
MTFKTASLAMASLLALLIAGCSTAPSQQAAAPATPTLSDEAKAALAQADATVKSAKANFTLWIPADTAYAKAQEAAKAGDSATVIKQAKIVADLSKIASAQANYPSTEMK